ncbi:hypothetical protein [Nonomuraea sp. NPDC003201]
MPERVARNWSTWPSTVTPTVAGRDAALPANRATEPDDEPFGLEAIAA